MKIFKEYILFIFFFHLLSYENCFLFSVIIPIYNTGRYLSDSIGSILNQTLGFPKIQLILINDGSIDNSNDICLKYQKQYMKNIIYIKINHCGVSKARNVGFKYSKGIYINFLDSDDKWDYDAFKHIFLFFKYSNKINYVAGRIIYFEKTNKYHPLDYKFYKTRIVNLSQEYNCIQLQASSSVFKKNILKGFIFNEEVSFSEDTRLINIILLINPIMGLIKESKYYYRKRNDLSSAVQNKENNLNFYFESINSVFLYFINISLFLYNKIVPFIQFLISYEFLYRFQSLGFKFLDSRNFKKYIFLIEGILKQIEDKYILEQRIMPNKHKLFMLSKKYHKDLRYEIQIKNNSLIYLNYSLLNFNREKYIISLKLLNLKKNILYLEAKDNFWMPRENYFYFCKLGNKIIYSKYIENPTYNIFNLYGLSEKGRFIFFEIPIQFSNEPLILYFYISYLDNIIEVFPDLGIFTHISNINNSYYIIDNFIIKYLSKRLIIFRYAKKFAINSELLYLNELKKKRKNHIIKIRKKHLKYRNRIKNKLKSEIWIINDELDKAGGNGEYFFRYLKLKNPNLIKPYFAILKNCSDYKRLKKFGGILDIHSKTYKFMFLESNKIISSVFTSLFYNPFNNDNKYIRDLFHFDIIFLQNSILKDDISIHINKFKINFNLISISSKIEHKNILNKNYGYNADNIILTGMPRYDKIQKLKKLTIIKKKILIIPAYRTIIKGHVNSLFNITAFFNFYNQLMNNDNLLLNMKKFNYSGIFCLQPLLKSQMIDFKQNQFFSIIKECDYQKYLLETSLLITDYSSIFFDFGYLGKPVIYTHFDYQCWKASFNDKDNFNYNKYGFGTICRDIQCTVNEIIFELKNNCLLRNKFLKRIKKFFAFIDNNNSERVFQEILKLKIKDVKKEINFNIIHLFFAIISLMILINFYKKLFNISMNKY